MIALALVAVLVLAVRLLTSPAVLTAAGAAALVALAHHAAAPSTGRAGQAGAVLVARVDLIAHIGLCLALALVAAGLIVICRTLAGTQWRILMVAREVRA